MAFPPMYAQQAQGTLMPGQMIAVNKYNVQVEKYLSQGGFAHVYLVRTEEPVLGTTHHVLKRIAVANEAMLNDVKKEVDIMRILRGHPNIVYLIDAAWHKMPNGMFEVFILMEFCSGGGIIDMMNRRLRERLTESEILQIFVDLCEGVAAMHNLRPPLLHRDIKIENILQASATSFKLCDFGSAMPVAQRPPSSMQELRALEADLNKHTTLQYRAPEMVDVYLRRPIDEKSDVWALGVLLYKLCYYTTPFEEHGVLAILNVQYKFPPYPVYSQQLNALIASMLREHNVHRPSVFEILDTVHKMRGTKSRFTYNPPKPAISPRPALSPVPASSTKSPESVGSPPTNGIQAREKVLEAIAPMRRGRPSSPTRGRKIPSDAFNLLDSIEGGPWMTKPAKAHKSGLAAVSMAKSPPPVNVANSGEAWQVLGTKGEKRQPMGAVNGFADSFNARTSTSSSPAPVPVPAPRPVPGRTNSSLKPPGGDAFESLSLFPLPNQQPLTLGEARKAASNRPTPSPRLTNQNLSISPSPSFQSSSPASTDNTVPRRDVSPLLKSKASDQTFAAEQRFPSLEELDAGNFGAGAVPSSDSVSAPSTAPVPSPAPPQLPPRPVVRQDQSASFYPASVAGALRQTLETNMVAPIALRNEGVRSQHVTGTAMRDARRAQIPLSRPAAATSSNWFKPESKPEQSNARQSRLDIGVREKLQAPSRPVLTRKHRSSVSIKQAQKTGSEASSPKRPVSGLPIASDTPQDWLTGTNDGENASRIDDAAVLRASPEKRASVLVSEGPPDIGRAASFRETVSSPVKRKPVPFERLESVKPERTDSVAEKGIIDDRTGGLTENWSPVGPKSSSSDDEDEGPEDVVSSIRPSKVVTRAPIQQRLGHKGRQGSVHDLVDLWGGSGPPKPSPSKQNNRNSVLTPQSGNVTATKRSKSPSPIPMSKQLSTTPTTPSGKQSPTKPATSISRNSSGASRHAHTSHVKQPSSPTKSHQASSSSSASRSRPQSMLFFPVQKSASEMAPQTPAKASLTTPANKGRSAHRRSSISDLVSRYEAIGEQSKGSKPGLPFAPAPIPATKPARLRVVSPSSVSSVAASEPTISPTAASARFPRISPTSSPKEPVKSSFSSGLEAQAQTTENSRPRDTDSSPASRSGSRAPSPLLQRLTSSLADRGPTGVPSPKESSRSEETPVKTKLNSLLTKDSVEASASAVSKEDGRRSPSPERPYQGVSKLIDQWQRKTEGATGVRGSSNTSLRGTGSRFRRDGIAAGGKAV